MFDDRTYTNLCVPAFIELPYQSHGKDYQEKHESDPLRKTAPMGNCFCPQISLTLRKVAYGVLLHFISGLLYGSYAAYLGFSQQLKYSLHLECDLNALLD